MSERRGRPAGLAALLVAAAMAVAGGGGCRAMRAKPLDVIATERMVLGRVDIAQLSSPEVLVDLAREDGEFAQQIYVGRGAHEFALALVPGRYRIGSYRLVSEGFALGKDPTHYVRVTFDVGDAAAVYVGTLQLLPGFGDQGGARVVDEYDATLSVLRRLYTNIPSVVSRSLMRAG